MTQAIWTHLGTCDTSTNCQGLGPGLEPDEIKVFDEYPVLIEARMSKEGLLTFESILEESLVRCMESVMNSRVKWFESLVEDWEPDCTHAQTGCQVKDHETGQWGPWVSTFNIPLLESIAHGHFFDRSFAPVNEDIENVRHDNNRCIKLLDEWKSKISSELPECQLEDIQERRRSNSGIPEQAKNCYIGSWKVRKTSRSSPNCIQTSRSQ